MRSNWFRSWLPRPEMGICFFPGAAGGFQAPWPAGGATAGTPGSAALIPLPKAELVLIDVTFLRLCRKDLVFITPRISLAWRPSKVKYLTLVLGTGTGEDALGPTAGDASRARSPQKGHVAYSSNSIISWTQIFNVQPSFRFIKGHLLTAFTGSRLSYLHGGIDATHDWGDTFNLRIR